MQDTRPNAQRSVPLSEAHVSKQDGPPTLLSLYMCAFEFFASFLCPPWSFPLSAMAASPPKSLRLRINIGGQKIIEVQPELFRVAGDNKLSALFSGRWEPHLDASGNYFVDYSPEVFMPFVEWLREFRDTPPDQRPPCVDVDRGIAVQLSG